MDGGGDVFDVFLVWGSSPFILFLFFFPIFSLTTFQYKISNSFFSAGKNLAVNRRFFYTNYKGELFELGLVSEVVISWSNAIDFDLSP